MESKQEGDIPEVQDLEEDTIYVELEPPWETSLVEHWSLTEDSTHHVRLLTQDWGVDTNYVDWNCSRIAVVFTDDEIKSQYETMINDMNSHYTCMQDNSDTCVHPTELEIGHFVAVYNPSRELFVRATIIDIKEKDYHVYAFDYEDRFKVTENDVFPMLVKFMELQPRSVSFTLDGFEGFYRCSQLKYIIEHDDTWKNYRAREWTVIVTQIKFETIFVKMYPRYSDSDGDKYFENFNFTVLKKLWLSCTHPRLPKVNESKQGFIVNFENDGRVFIQFDSPFYAEFQRYSAVAWPKLELLMQDPDYKAPLPLDPNKIYMAPQPTENQGYQFFRVKYIPETPPESPNKTSENVRVKYIDYGNEAVINAIALVLASTVHPFLGIVPAQCVEAHLKNVSCMDGNKIAEDEIITDTIPFLIKTVVEANESGELAEVEVYKDMIVEDDQLKILINLAEDMIFFRIATAESQSKNDKSGKVLLTDKPVELFQSTYIEMNDWKCAFNYEKIDQDTSSIYFKIGNVRQNQDFTIKSMEAGSCIISMSEEIRKHIKTPWYELGKRHFDYDFTPRWFYGWHDKKRDIYCRVRFVKYLERARLLTSTAKILVIDFGEYIDTQLGDLERSLPLSICSIPPQSVVASLGVDCSASFNTDKGASEEDKINAFKKIYAKKICCGEVKYTEVDDMGLTTVFLKNLINTESKGAMHKSTRLK